MGAVIALTAKNIRADHDAVTHLERNTLEVFVLSVAADRRDRAHVLMSLDDGKRNLLVVAST